MVTKQENNQAQLETMGQIENVYKVWGKLRSQEYVEDLKEWEKDLKKRINSLNLVLKELKQEEEKLW
jgi:hypothetical protein